MLDTIRTTTLTILRIPATAGAAPLISENVEGVLRAPATIGRAHRLLRAAFAHDAVWPEAAGGIVMSPVMFVSVIPFVVMTTAN